MAVIASVTLQLGQVFSLESTFPQIKVQVKPCIFQNVISLNNYVFRGAGMQAPGKHVIFLCNCNGHSSVCWCSGKAHLCCEPPAETEN